MEKFIQPRGTGRTYNICKYAIEHDCDIVSPTMCSVDNCLETIKKICEKSDGEYIFCKIKPWDIEYEVFVFRRDEEDLLKIAVYNIRQWQALIGNRKHIVVDDIDECLRKIICVGIDACSIESYDPTDVALKKKLNE